MGGSDPENVTLKVIKALQQIGMDGLETKVAVGWNNPHYNELKSTILESNNSIQLLRDVNDMPRLMAWADVAVSAGGSTCWEMAFMGLPAIVFSLGDNQNEAVETLARKKYFIKMNATLNFEIDSICQVLKNLLGNYELRLDISLRCASLINGLSAKRVVKQITSTK